MKYGSLKKQMLSRVNWVDAVNNLNGDNIFFLEIGPSKILRDLLARIDPSINVDSVALYDDLGDCISKFRT